jgi:hypothetical protein
MGRYSRQSSGLNPYQCLKIGQGRDLLSRLIHGTRVALGTPFPAVPSATRQKRLPFALTAVQVIIALIVKNSIRPSGQGEIPDRR